MTTNYGSAKVTTPADTDILITRTFEAPAPLVWEAMTQPRHVLRWWGPTWSPLVSCAIDLRVGGSWRYVSRMDDGTELGGTVRTSRSMPDHGWCRRRCSRVIRTPSPPTRSRSRSGTA